MTTTRKRQYTKTQMRLNSYPAREKPEFPKPALPPIHVETEETPEVEEIQAVVELPPAPILERIVDDGVPTIAEVLTSRIRPFDPWHGEEGPAEWRGWFQAKGRPSRLLGRTGLSYFCDPEGLARELENDFAEAEVRTAGIEPDCLSVNLLANALVFPIRSGKKVEGLETRNPDGSLLFRIGHEDSGHLIFRPFALGDYPRGTSMLISDRFLWVLEELALGQPAVYVEGHENLPRWWPQEFERYQTLLAFEEPRAVGHQRLDVQFKSWGVQARMVNDAQRRNRLMMMHLAHEAAGPFQPSGEERHQIVDRIRDILNRMPRWFRHESHHS